MTFYCSVDGCGPLPSVDWNARFAEAFEATLTIDDPSIAAEARAAASTALHAERIAVASHVVANGNGPRCTAHAPHEVASMLASGAALVAVAAERDEHGGGVASLVRPDGSLLGALLCPVCPAQVRAVESP